MFEIKNIVLTADGFDISKFAIDNGRIISSIVVIILAIILTKVSRRLIHDSIVFFIPDKSKTKKNILLRSYLNIISNVIKYLIYLIAVVIILMIYQVQITVMIASAGFIGVMVTYVFQDLIKDVTNGFFILFSAPFQIGDTIKIGDFVGKVREIQSRYIVLVDASGNKAIINNRAIDTVVVLDSTINFRKKVR